MRRLLLSLILLLVPVMAGAQGNTNTVPPMCTAATLLTVCVPQVQGTIARITDATDATVCTNSGAGTTDVTCQFNGTSWGPMPTIAAAGGTWTGANSETLTNATNSEFIFTRNDGGAVTLKAADSAAPASLVIDTTTTGTITVGSGDVASAAIIVDDVVLEVGTNNPQTVSIENDSTGSVILDFRDYGDTADDDMAHSSISTNCTTATTGAEECDLNINITTGGAGIEIAAFDPAGGIELGDATTTAVTLTTDSTGDAEVVLPGSSVGFAEQGFVTIGADPAATCVAGSIHIDTDESDDTNCTTTLDNSICLCLTTNTWTTYAGDPGA